MKIACSFCSFYSSKSGPAAALLGPPVAAMVLRTCLTTKLKAKNPHITNKLVAAP